MRLFLAIFPPDDFRDFFRDSLRALDKEKRNIRPVPIDQVHLTMRFLGSRVSDQSFHALAEELKRHQGSFPKPQIALEELHLGFPRQKYPSAIFAGLQSSDGLEDLTRTVHEYVKAVGAEDTILWRQPGDTDYHMTIARLKEAAVTRSTVRRIQDLIGQTSLPTPQPFVAREMYFVQSIIPNASGTPIYKVLDRITL